MVCGDSLGTLSDELGGCSSNSAEQGMSATNIDSECVILDTSHVSDTIQPLVNAGNDSFANSLMLLLYSIPQFVEELHVLKSNMPLADSLLKSFAKLRNAKSASDPSTHYDTILQNLPK